MSLIGRALGSARDVNMIVTLVVIITAFPAAFALTKGLGAAVGQMSSAGGKKVFWPSAALRVPFKHAGLARDVAVLSSGARETDAHTCSARWSKRRCRNARSFGALFLSVFGRWLAGLLAGWLAAGWLASA